tara:strand:- start:14 stop:157 length:144 start_codon:yes stop_codon:yes gene_type:complete
MDEAKQTDGKKIIKLKNNLIIIKVIISYYWQKKMEIWSLLFGAGKGT